VVRRLAGRTALGHGRATCGIAPQLHNTEREPLDPQAVEVPEPALAVDEVLPTLRDVLVRLHRPVLAVLQHDEVELIAGRA
jgi:hypothetical protein